MAVKVGTFQKSVAAAPVAQSVVGVGFQVKALILWTSSRTAFDAWSVHIIHAIGMSDGTRSYSTCQAAENGVAAGDVCRRWNHVALTICDYNNTLQAEAELASFDDDGFTLNWTTNNATAYEIHYLCLGGDDLTAVYLKEWTLTNVVGNQSVGGIGFRPELVIHLGAYMAADGTADSAYQGLGAMDSNGNQFAIGSAAFQWIGSISNKSMMVSECYCLPDGSAAANDLIHLQYVSMDADGFTVNLTQHRGVNSLVASLCLAGGDYAVGHLHVPGAIGNQSTAGLGLMPEGVMFGGTFCAQDTVHAADSMWTLGAMDGAAQGATSHWNQNGANPSNCKSLATESYCIYESNVASVSLNLAQFVSFDAGGFTIDWTQVNTPTNAIGFIAFDTGPITPPVPPSPTPFTPINSCDASIWLEDGSGTLRDISGSSNKLRVSLSRATGFLRVFQFRWPLRLGGGKDAAFELDAAYTMAQDEAKDILLNWYNEDSPGPRALHLYPAGKNVGEDHFYGDVVIRKLAFQPAAGEGAPMLINAEMLPTGEWSYTTAAT